MLFRKNLMKKPSPNNLKYLLKFINHPKDVKRGENANDAPNDERNEMYDCDEDEISCPINIEDQFGPPSNDENK